MLHAVNHSGTIGLFEHVDDALHAQQIGAEVFRESRQEQAQRDGVHGLFAGNAETFEALSVAMRVIRDMLGEPCLQVRRVLLMEEPPQVDGNEITDKGYINQRATLERRKALVEKLYAGGDGVIDVA